MRLCAIRVRFGAVVAVEDVFSASEYSLCDVCVLYDSLGEMQGLGLKVKGDCN